MCSRYWIDKTPTMDSIVEEMNASPLIRAWQKTLKIISQGEVFPTDVVPVISPNRKGERTVFPMEWDYTGKSLLINARRETAAEKPSFRKTGRDIAASSRLRGILNGSIL